MKVVNVIAAALLALAVPAVVAQETRTEAAAQAAPPAPESIGTVTVNGKSASLRYVYAIRGPAFMNEKKEEIRIILSDVPVAVDELISDSAIMSRGLAGKVSGVVARLDMEANADTGELYHSGFDRMQMALYGEHAFQPTVFDDQRVAGTLFMPEPRESSGFTYHYTATFDVAIQRQSDLKDQVAAAAATEAASRVPPTAEEAAAAAASGPGKVVSAFLTAMRAQDLPAMKKLAANPQMFADLEGPFGGMAMGLMAEAFKGVHVTRVTQTGDTAIVEVEGLNLKAPGKIPTVLVKDVWKLAEKDGKNAPEAASPTDASAAEGTSTPETPANEGSGTLTVGETTVPLRHAYAFLEPSRAISGKEDVRVVLSDVPLTFVKQEDGFFVPEEAVSSSDEKEAGWRNRVEVTFDPEDKTQRFGVIYHGGPGAEAISITSEFEPAAFDDQRIAGKLFVYGEGVFINEVKVHYTASFDVAIQGTASKLPTTLQGADAAASGPGKVVLAIARAAQSEDREAFQLHLSEEFRKSVEDGAFQLGVLFQMLPSEEVTIISVTETGDEAVVVCESGPADDRSGAELKLVRESGEWKLKR